MHPPTGLNLPPWGSFLLAMLAAAPVPAAGQTSGPWNPPRVLELVDRGRAERATAIVDGAFDSYVADARGYLYFFLDREDTGERNLVKTDQIAVQMLWKAPDLFKQEIVGLRDEKRLPTSIRYHVDHLTVVQDEFGDVIRMGRGDEVADVAHPLALGAEAVYDYRLVDSISISFAAETEPVRVYEVQVRPKDFDQAGFVGTVFLDRESAAVVRMSFTFTPASYVDGYLDYIRISLDNALWNRRYWLPYRQSVEIRREFPYLDLPAGSIIQGRWEIRSYDFDSELTDELFEGPRVTSRGRTALREFPFERGLYDQIDDEGLGPTPELDELEAEVGRLVGSRYLSGLRQLRLLLPPFSEAVRYNRAEGWVTGAGLRLQPTRQLGLSAVGGYAHARERPTARLSGFLGQGGAERPNATGFELYLNSMRDIGPVAGSSGLVNTLSSLLWQTDQLDPYFTTGARLRLGGAIGPVRGVAGVRYERHRSAHAAVSAGREDRGWRPVRPVDEGDLVALEVTASVGEEDLLRGELAGTYGSFEGTEHQSVTIHLSTMRRWLGEGVELRSEVLAGTVSSGAPLQSLFLMGGRETLPGYDYRSLVGDSFWLIKVEGSRAVLGPWLRFRGFGSVGDTSLSRNEVPASWSAAPPRIPLFSAGLGLGLGWDTVQLDFGRGLNGGDWEVMFGVNWRFRSML